MGKMLFKVLPFFCYEIVNCTTIWNSKLPMGIWLEIQWLSSVLGTIKCSLIGTLWCFSEKFNFLDCYGLQQMLMITFEWFFKKVC